ncbi:MAG: hypothetical protein IJ418_03195 [Clostridia bacterium]|nr:hypothetical protein [Clostridia bacterium]
MFVKQGGTADVFSASVLVWGQVRFFVPSPRKPAPTEQELIIDDAAKVIADRFGGDAGDAFSAICGLQKSRFASSKPSTSAIASDEKFIRHLTPAFNHRLPEQQKGRFP